MDQLTQRWTQDDDDTIRLWGSKISLERLAIKLRRSKAAVKNRARALDVKIGKPSRLPPQERHYWS